MGLILPLLLSVSIAVAQDDSQVAKQFYLNGKMLFEEERYEEAIIAWEKAYEKSEKPVILYNIAIAYEKLESYQQAIDTLYRYRIYAPQEEQVDLVAKIDELKIQLESNQAESNRPQDDYQIDKVEVADKKSERVETLTPIAEVEEQTSEKVLPTIEGLKTVNKVPLYTAWGVGAASLSTGIIFGVLANQSNNRAENAGGCGTTTKGVLLCTSDSDGEAYYWEARQRSIIADVGYGLSVLSLGTGLWLMSKDADGSSRTVTSHVWVTPNSFGLQRRF